MTDEGVALRTGMIAGLLMEAHMNGMVQFVTVPRLDADGFTNVIDLLRDGVVEYTVTVERASYALTQAELDAHMATRRPPGTPG